MFISYAQNGEDVWLQRVFENKNDGFYIDVGAHMPVFDSVTKTFYDRGWRGINIEPIPHLHAQFVAERKRDINLQVGVGDQIDTLELHVPPLGQQGVASFDPTSTEIVKAHGLAGTNLLVDVTTLTTICNQHVTEPIDFLKIDVEGFEKQVIAGMDFVKFRPTILIVEATKALHLMRDPVADAHMTTWHDWEPLLMEADYVFATFDGLNRYYVRSEDQALVSKFIIPISPLVDGYIKNDFNCNVPSRVDDEAANNEYYDQIIEPWNGTSFDSKNIKVLSRALAHLYLS